MPIIFRQWLQCDKKQDELTSVLKEIFVPIINKNQINRYNNKSLIKSEIIMGIN